MRELNLDQLRTLVAIADLGGFSAAGRALHLAQPTISLHVSELESRIAEREREIKELEARMSAPGFYDDRTAADSVVSRHQTLMWEVGDLMHQWESLQGA